MRSTRPPVSSGLSSSEFVIKGRRSVPFLPGLLLLALGIVLLVAPRLVLGAIAFCLLAFGALFCYVAFKFVTLRKQVNELAKSMEGSLFTGSMRGTKPDIDISDEEPVEIVYH